MHANEASSSQAFGRKSAPFLVTWLTVQLVTVVLMVTLVGFHYGQTRSTLCLTTLNSSNIGAVNSSSSAGPSCVSNQVALLFTVIASIITVIDATINMDYLIHRVKNEKLPSGCCCYCCIDCCFTFLPMGIVRVWYCWILIHIILITIAANTYEWTWQTDDLDVLSNTAMFFSASLMYLVLFVAICIWQYTILRTFVTTKLGKNCMDQSNEDQTKSYQRQQNGYCILIHCLTSALFLSHVLATIATLITFFDRSDLDGPSHNRVVIEIVVIVYVCLSSLFWFAGIVSYNIVNILEMYDTSKYISPFRTTGIILIVIIVIILFVSVFFYIGLRAIFLNSIVLIIFLSLLGFTLIFWLIITGLNFCFCTYLLLQLYIGCLNIGIRLALLFI